MLGVDTVAARAYLRQVQKLVGPVPYDAIVAAMQRAQSLAVEDVTAVISTEQAQSHK